MSLRDKFWMWGYTDEHAARIRPQGDTKGFCSVERAVSYFGFSNAVFMNTFFSFEKVEEHLLHLKDCKEILCGLPPGIASVDGARRISELSLNFPQIKGAVLDDFNQLPGQPEAISRKSFPTPELVKQIHNNLLSANSALELHAVQYSDGNHYPIEPYLEYLDGIMMWRWVSTEEFWRSGFFPLIHRLKVTTGKKITHGVYIQNYGEYGEVLHPVDFELWKLQWMKILNIMREGYPFLDGCVLLQNGRLSMPQFRDHAVWLKETLDWFFETTGEI